MFYPLPINPLAIPLATPVISNVVNSNGVGSLNNLLTICIIFGQFKVWPTLVKKLIDR